MIQAPGKFFLQILCSAFLVARCRGDVPTFTAKIERFSRAVLRGNLSKLQAMMGECTRFVEGLLEVKRGRRKQERAGQCSVVAAEGLATGLHSPVTLDEKPPNVMELHFFRFRFFSLVPNARSLRYEYAVRVRTST